MNRLLIVLLLGLGAATATAQMAPLPPLPPLPSLGPSASPPSGALPAGLYVQVIDGLIQLTNRTGSQNFAPGQFGFTPSPTVPPIIVPGNPGLLFTPPPVFNVNTGPTAKTGGTKTAAVDCEVR